MNKIVKQSILLVYISLLSGCTLNINNKDNNIDDNNKSSITFDESGKYVYFGNYPQKEIVDIATRSGVNTKVYETSEDYIIDTNTYNILVNLTDDKYDNNQDTIIDNIKYHRIKKSDATYATNDDVNYYNWTTDNEYHYFKYEPIKWRILKENTNNYFLLSDIVLDDQKYNTDITNITWETSTIRSYLNGYDNTYNNYSTDYSNNNFINMAFTSDEQALIESTTVINNDSIKHGSEGGNDTIDKIFLLSEEEVYGETASSYGFDLDYDSHDLNRVSKSSTYAKAMGVYSDNETDYIGNCDWWIRTPGSYTGLFDLVLSNGRVYRGGQHANSKTRGIRPALYLTKE